MIELKQELFAVDCFTEAGSPSQSNPSDLPAPPKGGVSDESARLAFYLETAPLLQKAPPSGELANECEPERARPFSEKKSLSCKNREGQTLRRNKWKKIM